MSHHRTPLVTSLLISILMAFPIFRAPAAPQNAMVYGDAGRTFADTVGLNVKYSQGEPQKDLPLLKELGVRWVRDGVSWPEIEPAPGQYVEFPPAFQERLKFYKTNKIGIVFLLGYENPKAYPDTPDKPHNAFNAKGFGGYAAAVARMLKASGVRFTLEIWNEPHNFGIAKAFGGAWNAKAPSPWVDHYIEMAHEAVARVKAVDPRITMIDCDDMWVIHYWFLEKGLPAKLDGFGFHPYAPGGPEKAAVDQDTDWVKPFTAVDADGSFQSAVRRLQEAGKAKLGHTPQMWATEWGWTLGEKSPRGPVTEELLAGLLPRAFVTADAAGVKTVCWFSSYDSVDGPMGLRANNGTKRKMYFAMQAMTREIGQYRLVKQIAGADHLTSGTQAYLFRHGRHIKAVAWNIDGPASVTIACNKRGPISIHDVFGNPLPAAQIANGSITLTLGPSPIYIEGIDGDVKLVPNS